MRIATIRWGRGKFHLYDFEAVETVCGKEAPTDWMCVEGGVTYLVTNHYQTTLDCRACVLAATAENLERCDVW